MTQLALDLGPAATTPARPATRPADAALAARPGGFGPIGPELPIRSDVPWPLRRDIPGRDVFFFLGIHQRAWLEQSPVPVLLALHRLDGQLNDRIPRGFTPWALDSGGFNELRIHGEWRLNPYDYGSAVVRVTEYAGPPIFAATQDWMCEPMVIHGGTTKDGRFAGTGLDVRTHQQLTVESYALLTEEFPFIPWLPTVQGYRLDEYLECVELYRSYGVDLCDGRLVGLGSVCRRERTDEIGRIVETLSGMGMSLHGFGVKRAGLVRYGHVLDSVDSAAWSYGARRRNLRHPDCFHAAPDCRNCLRQAVTWRDETLTQLQAARARQLALAA